MKIRTIRLGGSAALVAALTMGAPLFANAGSSGDHFHIVSRGDFAYAAWSSTDASGSLFAEVTVSRRSGDEAEGASLGYDFTRCDPSGSCVSESGFGDIPGGDLTGNAQSGLQLRVNTAELQGFFNSGAGGLVVVDWRKDGLIVETAGGTYTHRGTGYAERRQGKSTYMSAQVSGEMLGLPIGPAATATIGTRHSVEIDFYRER